MKIKMINKMKNKMSNKMINRNNKKSQNQICDNKKYLKFINKSNKKFSIEHILILFAVILVCLSLILSSYKTANASESNQNIRVVEKNSNETIDVHANKLTRITCSEGRILKPIFSNEKNLETFPGNNNDYYIKNTVLEEFDEEENKMIEHYDNRVKEIFVTCGNQVFSFQIKPTKYSKTNLIMLKNDQNESSTTANTGEKPDYDEEIRRLIKSVYFEKVPYGYKVNKKIERFYAGDFMFTKRLEYIGQNFIIEDYLVANPYALQHEIALNPKDFADVFKDYRAITFSSNKLDRYMTKVRLIAVKKK